jgi:hypothetical protein
VIFTWLLGLITLVAGATQCGVQFICRPSLDVPANLGHVFPFPFLLRSSKVVMEKVLDGEEMITITIRDSMMDSHVEKVERSTSARNDEKREPNGTN